MLRWGETLPTNAQKRSRRRFGFDLRREKLLFYGDFMRSCAAGGHTVHGKEMGKSVCASGGAYNMNIEQAIPPLFSAFDQ